MNNLIECIPETSIKLEHIRINACRFCVNNTINLTSITSNTTVPIPNPTNDCEENGKNYTINISELIHNCFGLDINSLEHLPQYVCNVCIKRFIEAYAFRKQCIWALNYWEHLYHMENENADKAKKPDMSFTATLLDEKPTLPLDVASNFELNKMHTKIAELNALGNIIGDINNDNNNNNNYNNNKDIKVKYVDKTKSIGKIKVKINKGKKPSSAQVCPYCGITRKNLSTHIQMHTNKMPQFICDFCGKIFKKKYNLYLHTRIHVNDRRYKCNLCAAAYVGPTSLRLHMLNHTDERNYVCNICAKNFKRADRLKSHILTHTLEKKFKCDYCDSLFINNSNKKKHHEIHHLREYKYQCEFCAQKFYTTSQLSVHRFLRHTKQNPYKCELCELKFTRLSEFNLHKRQHKYNII